MHEISLQSCRLSLPATTKEAIQSAAKSFAEDGIEDSLKDYPSTWGDPILRQRIDAMTPSWDGEVLVTGSATQGLNLALNTVGQGKTIAVKVPVYFGVLRTAKELGLDVKTWETVDDLEAIEDVDAVLLSSNFVSPTGQSFSAEEKKRIADIASANDSWVIEDNAYDPIWYDQFPDPIPSNPKKTIRVCSLSKISAPGFRLGFVKADPAVMKSLRSAKITHDLSTSPIPQILARDALKEDVLRDFRQEMRERVELLRTSIHEKTGIEIVQPDGGPFVCFDLPEGIDAKTLQEKLATLGVRVDTNERYYPDEQARPYLRLNAGAATKEELVVASSRISLALGLMVLENQPVAKEFKAQASPHPLQGKTILVTGGTVKENIDGVRHFANCEREEGQGHQLASALVDLGANVLLVTAKTRIAPPEGAIVTSETLDGNTIQNTSDLLQTVSEVVGAVNIDAAISMASVPSIRFAHETDQKMKVKNDPGDAVVLDVQKNSSPIEALTQVLSNSEKTVLGYDQSQNFVHGREGDYAADILSVLDEIRGQPVPAAPKEEIEVGECHSEPLSGKKVIVTSGHTHEKITPAGDVITNFASGRQGHAVAQALTNMGAEVVLVTGPTLVSDPVGSNAKAVHVKTARELQQSCLKELPAEAAVCVCAVGDFRAEKVEDIAFDEEGFGKLVMAQNPDTLKTLGLHDTHRPDIVIGFAAETRDLVRYATGKLEKKGADAICANQVGSTMVARGTQRNAIQFVTREGVAVWEETSKAEVGFQIGRQINILAGHKVAAEIENRLNHHDDTSEYTGDFVLTPNLISVFAQRALREAAVLVPLVVDEDGVSVLLTKRADHMRLHPGEWSFPGGGVDGTDDSRANTALRETDEEIGLKREHVRIIGQLPSYHVRTGFNVAPIVGVIQRPLDLILNTDEVSEVMQVPLAHFFVEENCGILDKEFEGQPIKLFGFSYQEQEISGASAGILVCFRDVLVSNEQSLVDRDALAKLLPKI